ncbi:tRNA (adenosine(37)-N6)-dimethylallyltransferase MiaA [Candidatus Saccharibacteria bacterium]|nr:MAG: tRNA (adenosine(37)-N6)-dimethylallyltransferase MiaA [Candidatus Saccharibacteria bacterium]
MATEALDPPLIVIAGPTASGKTALAIRLAKQFNGEIICADSRTIYKGMDIGTAKPSRAEQSEVVHWGLDLVEPNQKFSVADFKQYAENKIVEIRQKGKTPILVGGSGLYIDSLIFDFQFGPPADEKLRQSLEEKTVNDLKSYCIKNNIPLPENSNNKRYLVRTIEQKTINNSRNQRPINNCFVVGITTSKKNLRHRIESRADKIFSSGVINEAISLAENYGWEGEAMTGNIYRLIKQHLDGEYDFEELKRRFVISDWQLAKRQMTWFRRNPYLMWGSTQAIEQYISKNLAD